MPNCEHVGIHCASYRLASDHKHMLPFYAKQFNCASYRFFFLPPPLRTMMVEWLPSCPAPSHLFYKLAWDRARSTQWTWWPSETRVAVSPSPPPSRHVRTEFGIDSLLYAIFFFLTLLFASTHVKFYISWAQLQNPNYVDGIVWQINMTYRSI